MPEYVAVGVAAIDATDLMHQLPELLYLASFTRTAFIAAGYFHFFIVGSANNDARIITAATCRLLIYYRPENNKCAAR